MAQRQRLQVGVMGDVGHMVRAFSEDALGVWSGAEGPLHAATATVVTVLEHIPALWI